MGTVWSRLYPFALAAFGLLSMASHPLCSVNHDSTRDTMRNSLSQPDSFFICDPWRSPR